MKKEFTFDDISESMKKTNELKLAKMVYEYSGDFVKRADCEELLNTNHVNRVVFFGDD